MTLVFSHVVSLWPLLCPHNAWVGTANPLSDIIKISKGKHIRDASVLARGFAVATFVPVHAWVGLFKCSRHLGVEIKRMDAPSLRLNAHCACEPAACAPDGRLPRQAIFMSWRRR
jgi:hypothetical protein